MYRNYDYYGNGRRNGRVAQQQQIQTAFTQMKQELIAWQQEAKRLENEVTQLKTAVSQQQQQIKQERQQAHHEISTLHEQIAQLQEKEETGQDEAEWEEKFAQLATDFEQSKARLEKRYAHETKQAQEQLLLDMLPVADNLERALTYVTLAEERAGIELTLKAFTAVLNKHGVEQIDAQNQHFDPTLHEAISVVQADKKPADTIVAVTENGYTINNKLLRPARVVVAKE